MHCKYRLFRRFFYFGAVLVLTLGGALQSVRATTPAQTQVVDTIYRADGSPAQGTVTIRWSGFTASDGTAIAAGVLSVKIGPGGSFLAALTPNTGSTPAGYYHVVFKLDDGTTSEETWAVPRAPTATIAAVRATLVPAAVAQQSVGRDYVDSEIASKMKMLSDAEVQTTGSYSNPSWITSIDGSKLTGVIPASALPASINANTNGSAATANALAATPAQCQPNLYATGIAANGNANCSQLSYSQISGAPALSAVASSGSYADLSGRPSVPSASTDLADSSTLVRKDAANTFTQAQTFSDVITKKIPKADVRAYGAKGDGTTDDTAAIQAAIAYVQSVAVGARPPVYLPAGTYLLSGELRVTPDVTLVGDGQDVTILKQSSATANAITVQGYNVARPLWSTSGRIADMTIEGSGSATHGNLLELDSSDSFRIEHIRLYDHGGRGLQLNDSSERFYSSDLEVNSVRWPIVAAGDINESYFINTRVINPGATNSDGYCYNANCVAGVYPASGPIKPDTRAAVYIDKAVNTAFIGGSIKPLKYLAGMKWWSAEADTLQNFYFEGYPSDAAPRLNASLIAGGVGESTTTTGAMTTSSLSVGVTSVLWMPHYYTTASDRPATNGNGNYYVIYPPDFVWGSSTASSLGGSITQGTYEVVNVNGFSGDGNLYLSGRGQSGTTAIAWPAGAIVAQKPGPYSSPLNIRNSHLNAMHNAGTGYSNDCDDSGSKTCGEVIAGFVPGGWVQPRGSSGDTTTAPGVSLTIDHSHIWGTGSDPLGKIKVHSGANINMSSSPSSLSLTEDAATSTAKAVDMSDTGQTGSQVIAVATPNSHSSVMSVSMPEIGKFADSASGLYGRITAAYDNSGGTFTVGRQYQNQWSIFDMPSGSTHPTNRFTVWGSPNNTAKQGFEHAIWTGTSWFQSLQHYAQSNGDTTLYVRATQNSHNAAVNFSDPTAIRWSTMFDGSTGRWQVYNAGTNHASLYIDPSTDAVNAPYGISSPSHSTTTTGGYCFNADTCIWRGGVAGQVKFGNATQGDSSATLLATSFSITSGYISYALMPSAAGSGSVGTNSAPFNSLYLGTAATNNIKLSGTATAARTIQLPDASGTMALVLSGTTGSIGASALTAGQCASGTVSVPNSTTAMAVAASPVTYPGDGFIWQGYVSAAGTVTVKVCAIVAGTPTASTYNVRVIQ